MATNLPSKEETLAPCPFCKVATNLRIANIIGGARAVNCTLCGTVGPHSELSDDYADEDAREQWNRGRAVETTADDRTQLHGALVRVVLEAEGCPPTCSHEFHKMAMASVIKIAKDALKRTSSVKAPAPRERKYSGAGHLEQTGYIPAGSAAERETATEPFAGLLSWGLRPDLPHCELSIRFRSVETAQAAREVIRGLIGWQSSPKTPGDSHG